MHIELDVSSNCDCNDIILEIYIGKNKIFQSTAQKQVQTIKQDIIEDPADHQLKLVMTGKNSTHTKINDEGQITSDVFFTVDRLEFEEIDMRELFCLGRNSWYRHSFNSEQPEFNDEFYGQLGCNGTVVIPFSTPIYLWLANNLDF
jgi:hypothetical protein